VGRRITLAINSLTSSVIMYIYCNLNVGISCSIKYLVKQLCLEDLFLWLS